MEDIFDYVLLTSDEIQQIIKEVGEKITKDYKGKNLVLICLLKGATPFMMDLIKHIDLPMQIDFMQACSYYGGTSASGLTFKKDIDLDVTNKDVIIVDDVIDSARTMSLIFDKFKDRKCASLEACCLLDKPCNREVEFKPKYVGKEIPDLFVVGYGLDYDEYYRNIPFIGVINPKYIK